MDRLSHIERPTSTRAPGYWRRATSALVGVTLMCALPFTGGAQSPSGTMRIKTDVPQVQVFLDGNDVGATPLTLTNVALGNHTLTLSKPGWIDHVESVNVEQGKIASMFILMKKLDTPMPALPAQFRAVHTHGMGQCVGSIVVQRDSISFKADDGQDVFAIPIRSVRLVARGSGVNVGAVAAEIAIKSALEARVATVVNTETGKPVPAVAEAMRTAPIVPPDAGTGSLVPLRLETPGRNYTFLAFESGDNPSAVLNKDSSATTVAANNQALFELVYRVYMEDLKAR